MAAKNVTAHILGIVQGVGFRPTVYLYAEKHHLSGWVLNSSRGVELEVHGEASDVDAFLDELRNFPPPQAKIDRFLVADAPYRLFSGFEIRESENHVDDFLPVSADLAICDDCKRELADPHDRRYRYPFINCTHCGPRFSIIREIPYDRPNTTMAEFTLCADCAGEYHNPADRRFHAQPVACPACGPEIWSEQAGQVTAHAETALQQARAWLKAGKILAVKGLGGFHLCCDAHSINAVQTLRQRKQRSAKPFALMAPSLQVIDRYARLTQAASELLNSPQAPVVLLELTEAGRELAAIVAPGQVRLGFMLPYTPLHILLTEAEPAFPDVLVMTSANLSEEPIAYTNSEARERLSTLADAFLLHNRPINMRIDDSVVALLREKPYFFRRARGFAPTPLVTSFQSEPLLATGTQLKNTFCLSRGPYHFVSHYIGDLENQETLTAFEQAICHYESLFRVQPKLIACDLHPDYMATRYAVSRATSQGLPLVAVQHHHAHIAACLAENNWDSAEPVIGLAFDGTGYGSDGTIWGGEVLLAGYHGFERRFHLLPARLPGGDLAVRKPARTALSYLLLAGLDPLEADLPSASYLGKEEAQAVIHQVQSGFNAPLTSSLGRLFDAAASLLGICHEVSFEAQAAAALEAAADPAEAGFYEIPLDGEVMDPRPLVIALVADRRAGLSLTRIAARFHNSLIQLSLNAARQLRAETGIRHVAISGGVWQNLYLMNRILPYLEADGFIPLFHQQLPPNDGCISLGQSAVAAHSIFTK